MLFLVIEVTRETGTQRRDNTLHIVIGVRWGGSWGVVLLLLTLIFVDLLKGLVHMLALLNGCEIEITYNIECDMQATDWLTIVI